MKGFIHARRPRAKNLCTLSGRTEEHIVSTKSPVAVANNLCLQVEPSTKLSSNPASWFYYYRHGFIIHSLGFVLEVEPFKVMPPPTDKEQPQKRLLMSSLPDPERAGIRPEKHISYSLSHNQRGLQGEDSKTYLSAFGFGKFGFTLITFSCIHLKHN